MTEEANGGNGDVLVNVLEVLETRRCWGLLQTTGGVQPDTNKQEKTLYEFLFLKQVNGRIIIYDWIYAIN